MKTQFTPIVRFVAGGLLCATLKAGAQDTRSTTDLSQAAKDEAVKMEAFNASDTSLGRYAEAMSATATKVPTELKALPISLQILNANAITDRKAQTVIDLYGYVAGM